jgi:hypothetical protein
VLLCKRAGEEKSRRTQEVDEDGSSKHARTVFCALRPLFIQFPQFYLDEHSCDQADQKTMASIDRNSWQRLVSQSDLNSGSCSSNLLYQPINFKCESAKAIVTLAPKCRFKVMQFLHSFLLFQCQ